MNCTCFPTEGLYILYIHPYVTTLGCSLNVIFQCDYYTCKRRSARTIRTDKCTFHLRIHSHTRANCLPLLQSNFEQYLLIIVLALFSYTYMYVYVCMCLTHINDFALCRPQTLWRRQWQQIWRMQQQQLCNNCSNHYFPLYCLLLLISTFFSFLHPTPAQCNCVAWTVNTSVYA